MIDVPFKGAMANLLHILSLLPHPEGGMRRTDEVEALDHHLIVAVDLEMILAIAKGALAHLLAHKVEVGLDPRRLVVWRQLNVKGAKDEVTLWLVYLNELAKLLVATDFGTVLVRPILEWWALICHLDGAPQGGGGEECGYGQCHCQKRQSTKCLAMDDHFVVCCANEVNALQMPQTLQLYFIWILAVQQCSRDGWRVVE